MKCPYCGCEDTQVKDSRGADEGNTIRRRRFCPQCDSRFTTFERVQLREMTVEKKNGSTKPFEHEKLHRSVCVAMRKRPVDDVTIEQAVNMIVRHLELRNEPCIRAEDIGIETLKVLRNLDRVAYIRYASVYNDFDGEEDFTAILHELAQENTAPIQTAKHRQSRLKAAGN